MTRRAAGGAAPTLLVLGATIFQIPVIEEARRLGCRVVTTDNVPSNPGHALADARHDVSTTDIDGVHRVAEAERADGVLAFASDPAALTAAVVSRRLGLPGLEPEAARVLTDKAAFRRHLRTVGVWVPEHAEVVTAAQAADALRRIGFPAMVKPVDSSGSKGVSRVDRPGQVDAALRHAMAVSRAGRAVVERFVLRDGVQLTGDGVCVDGRIVALFFATERFDERCSPHAPAGQSFPSAQPAAREARAAQVLQRVLDPLTGASFVFNADVFFTADDEVMVVEIGPRAGGNYVHRMLEQGTGCRFVEVAIRAALGWPIDPALYVARHRRPAATWVIHASADGRFDSLVCDPALRRHLLSVRMVKDTGSTVRRFGSSADALGFAALRFDDFEQMQAVMATLPERLYVRTTPVDAAPDAPVAASGGAPDRDPRDA